MKTYIRRGRSVVIPAEIADELGIRQGDEVEIETRNGVIIIHAIDAGVRRAEKHIELLREEVFGEKS